MDKNNRSSFTKALKTPSPPAKIKLFLENFENFDRKVSTSGGSRASCDQDSPIQDAQSEHPSCQRNLLNGQPNPLNGQQNPLNGQPNAPNVHLNPPNVHLNPSNGHLPSQPTNGEAKLNQLNLLAGHAPENQQPQIVNSCSKVQLNRTTDSLQSALHTEDFNCNAAVNRPLSSESQRSQHRLSSVSFRTRLGTNTGDALTNIVKKYQSIQAQNKCSVVLDDSTDEEPSATSDLSDTPAFNYSSDEEEEEHIQEEEPFSSSQNTNSIESSSNKLVNKNLRPYKSEPQLSSFEDSEDQSVSGGGGMYQDSLRYHSQTLKKSAKVFETVTVCGMDYYILNEIGEGGSSKVYQVCDFQKNEFYALKVVEMAKMAESLKGSLKKEIEILNMLKGCKRVIQLYAYEWNKESDKLMLVMEKGDSDLNTVLHKMIQNNDSKRKCLDLHTIKHYWNEMLKAVDEIHRKGVVHSDLKPVNFVIVKGYLKIIDFGIADAINPDHTSVVKANLVGTINFMSPESLMGRQAANGKKVIKVNCKSDVWSLGCILYNMCFGRTPFGHIEQIYEKINAICNNKFVITYPPFENADAVDCIKKCLLRNQQARPHVAELFQHPFLNREKAASANRLQAPSARVPIAARNPLLEKRIFDDIGSEVNQLTPRSLAKFKNVMKKELLKIKK